MKPAIVPDCEVVPDKVFVHDKNCLGCKKYEREVLLSITHSHGQNTSAQFNGKGFTDIILTKEQAEELRDKLVELLTVKTLKYSEFTDKVDELSKTERHCYGSIQYPAREAKEYFIQQGYINVEELFELFKLRKGALFTYAGD